jgi:outer membrane receptor protein involved in Fe transport
MNTRKNILASTIAFFVGAGGVSQGYAAENTEAEVSWLLEEVVVTATKRETSLQDTAMSISAIGGETIDKRNLVGMEDYLPFIPGVSMQDRGAGQNDIVIRGISIGSQFERNPATGIYFGETPVTGLSTPTDGQGAGSGDIKLVDIERVEVLRGPQGTLYGQGSLGGTVRVIPNKPSLSNFEGKVAARYSQTGEEGGDNTMVQGVINIPLIEDQLAVRAVAYQFDNDGYIDNIAASYQSESAVIAERVAQGGIAVDRKVGGAEYTGFRLSALWQPIEQLSVTLSYLNQEIEQDGFTAVDINLPGDYQQTSMAVDSDGQGEFITNETDIVNLVLEYDLGWGTLFSSTSNIEFEANSGFDASLLSFATVPDSTLNYRDMDILIEELRLVSTLDGPFQFLLGYYYEDRKKYTLNDLDSRGTEFIPDAPRVLLFEREVVVEQQSLFGELSYALTDQLTTTFGFRYFEYDQSQPISRLDGDVRTSQGLQRTVDDINYKLNISYQANDDTLIYAQWAEGFRRGRFQSTLVPERDDPDGNGLINFADGTERSVREGILDPDTTETFELGLKTSLMDNRVTLRTAIFHTDWQGMPLCFRGLGSTIFLNVGKSKVEGVEVEVQAQLSESLVLNFGSSYIEATLAEDASFLGGEKGEDLPGSAGFNLNLGLEYQFNVGEYDSFVRADYAYVDDYPHAFKSRIVEGDPVAGGYSLVNLKAGVEINAINLDLFVNNLTNANDFTWVDNLLNGLGSQRAYRLKPRTVGLNVSYRF